MENIFATLEPSEIISLAALLTAFISIVLTLVIASNNVRPLVAAIISTSGNKNRYLYIKNYGMGTAIIKNIYFQHIETKERNSDIFHFIKIKSEECEEYRIFSQKKYYLSPDEKVYIMLVSSNPEKEKNKDFIKNAELFSNNIITLRIVIKYRSVFGIPKKYRRDFKESGMKYYFGEVDV